MEDVNPERMDNRNPRYPRQAGKRASAAESGRVTGLSLKGAEMARTLVRLAAGSLSIEELGDERYGRAADGTLRLVIDDGTFDALDE
jgi:hypothetical protein